MEPNIGFSSNQKLFLSFKSNIKNDDMIIINNSEAKLNKSISNNNNYNWNSKKNNVSFEYPDKCGQGSQIKGSTWIKHISTKTKIHQFHINNNEWNQREYKHIKNNYISTIKYNIFTFIPKSLVVQFARVPNIYFWASAIMQSIKIISPLSAATAIIPWIFVLSVSMLREGIEDLSRHKYDKMNNQAEVIVYRKNKFVKTESQTIRVGEIILWYDNTQIPCDMVLLDTGLNEGNCYVETCSLDGEKALKEKISNKLSLGLFTKYVQGKSIENVSNIQVKGFCSCDEPNPNWNKINGIINLKTSDKTVEYPIYTSQTWLKGSIVKHSNYIIGVAWYTGWNNKIIMNSKRHRTKISKIEKSMNMYLIGIFIFQILLGSLSAVFHQTQYRSNKSFYTKYLWFEENPNWESFMIFFSYILLLNTLIPISLIVTLEIVKLIQGFFIKWDVELYSELQKKYCKPSSVSWNEELGNVNYIFTDKTGTLTCNKMEFKYCVIGETCYEYNTEYTTSSNTKFNLNKIVKNDPVTTNSVDISNNNNISNGDKIRENQHDKLKNIITCFLPDNLPGLKDDANINDSNNVTIQELNKLSTIQIGPNYFDKFVQRIIDNSGESTPTKLNKMNKELCTINEFWTAWACANECTCSETENGIEYSGVSPDDVELVKTASAQGYSWMRSSSDIKRIIIGKEEKEYKILNILNFSSERKRMSIILRQGNIIKIYTKGADCVISKRLGSNSNHNYLSATQNFMKKFSSKGYRTWMIASKELEENEYKVWNEKLRNIEMTISKKQSRIEELYNEIENNLNLLGTTMVEDKLQENVAETIKDLRLAGIKIWVLTGDKIETAENIALSCNWISPQYRSFKIASFETRLDTMRSDSDQFPEWDTFIYDFQLFISEQQENLWFLNSSIDSKQSENENEHLTWTPFSILIESTILAKIFKNEEATVEFLKIAVCASTVICCRVSPLQKSQVVKVVKNYEKKAITLAIGDGGNDVSMIWEAHIGIGLYGEEGMRAVQASDFAIGEFQYLRNWLFKHGRNNSNRVSYMIWYFFYKNFIFTMNHFFFSICCLGSGQTIIDDWFITFYNWIFTALPWGVQACTDFDVREDDSTWVKEMIPFWYKDSRDIPIFSISNFVLSLGRGWILSGINFFVIMGNVSQNPVGIKGHQPNLWFISLILYTNIIFSVSITLMLNIRYITAIFSVVIITTTFLLYIWFCVCVHYIKIFNSYSTILPALSSTKFYLLLFWFFGFSLLVDYTIASRRFAFSEDITTQLMLLNNDKKTRKPEMPIQIAKAKKNIEFISKNNNFTMLQGSCKRDQTQIIKKQIANDMLGYSKSKSLRSMKNVFGVNWKPFEITTWRRYTNTQERRRINNVNGVSWINPKDISHDSSTISKIHLKTPQEELNKNILTINN